VAAAAGTRRAVEHFVRDVLGCRCPDEVFERIEMPGAPGEIAGLPLQLRLEVGGRLLVCAVREGDVGRAAASLGAVFREGRALRDAQGLNRFRLVVLAGRPEEARGPLEAAFAALRLDDARLHLHVVDERDAPERAPGGWRAASRTAGPDL
jgi:hypothetical protein